MRSGGDRANRELVASNSISIHQSNKTNQTCWVSVAAILVVLSASSVAQDRPAQQLHSYSVSVQQLQISPRTRAHLAKAQKHFREAKLDSAMAELRSALSEAPKCAEALALRALVNLALRHPTEAIADSIRAASLDPGNPQAFLALATAYNSVRDFDKAESSARQALNLAPELWQARLEIAKSLYGQRQLNSALRQLDDLHTDFADVHLVRGDVLMELGRKQEAATEFSAFLSEAPRDPRCETIQRILKQVDSGNAL